MKVWVGTKHAIEAERGGLEGLPDHVRNEPGALVECLIWHPVDAGCAAALLEQKGSQPASADRGLRREVGRAAIKVGLRRPLG